MQPQQLRLLAQRDDEKLSVVVICNNNGVSIPSALTMSGMVLPWPTTNAFPFSAWSFVINAAGSFAGITIGVR
jgi:hypothetical protein